MRNPFLLVVFLVLMFGQMSNVTAQSFGYEYVRIPEGIGVIVNERFGPDAFPDADGYWNPNAEQVRKAEELIVPIRGSNPPEIAPDPSVDINELASRQYYGLSEEGQKLIYINGFCTGGLLADPTRFLIVMDGGSCFWQATIDTETWELISYTENGDA